MPGLTPGYSCAMTQNAHLPRAVPALILAASIAVLGSAFAFQYLGGYAPCKLCYWQRWPYALAIPASLLALALLARDNRFWARAVVGLCGLAFVIGGGIAVYHVGIENGWWQGPTTCSGPAFEADSIDALMAQIEQAPVIRCDQVQWSLFGISMAGFNVLISFGLAAFALIPALWRYIAGART